MTRRIGSESSAVAAMAGHSAAAGQDGRAEARFWKQRVRQGVSERECEVRRKSVLAGQTRAARPR
jgi:hypothetical protein